MYALNVIEYTADDVYDAQFPGGCDLLCDHEIVCGSVIVDIGGLVFAHKRCVDAHNTKMNALLLDDWAAQREAMNVRPLIGWHERVLELAFVTYRSTRKRKSDG